MLSILLNLSTLQVDYTAAFVCSPIDWPPDYDNMTKEEQQQSGVYVEMPKGFGIPGKVLKLKRSLYGLRQSPQNFYEYLKKRLEYCEFQQSENDACLFYTEKVICLIYVDDTLFFARDKSDIDEVIQKLEKGSNLKTTVEDDVAGYLGVLINREKEGEIELTQANLIDRIIAVLNLGDANPKGTLTTYGTLPKDSNGYAPQGTYNY